MPDPAAYAWNATARRFRDPGTGQFVARPAVRAAIDATLDAASAEARSLAESLASGAIDRVGFVKALRKLTKDAVVASGTLAAGGRAMVTPSLMGSFGAWVKAQYAYLDGLSREIEDGLALDGNFLARVSLYPLSGTAAYEAVLRSGDIEAGLSEERRTLGGPNPCPGCIAEAAKGWQPAGVLLPIGGCQCLNRCRCRFSRRRPGASVTLSAPVDFAPQAFARGPAVDFAGPPGGKPKGKGKLSGGHWVTIHGHPAYIRGGKVVAGGGVGHTHDGQGKPSGTPVPIDRNDVPLARAHVVREARKAEVAARIRANAPGKDTTGVDHEAMRAAVARHAAAEGTPGKPRDARYEHGPAAGKADRAHLAEAEARGGVAVKVTHAEKVTAERGRNGTTYHAGDLGSGRSAVARVGHHEGEDGKYPVTFGHGAPEAHRTLASAHRSARKAAVASAREGTTVDRLIVKPAHHDPDQIARYARNHAGDRTTVRVIHRGRGESVGFAGPAGDHAGATPARVIRE